MLLKNGVFFDGADSAILKVRMFDGGDVLINRMICCSCNKEIRNSISVSDTEKGIGEAGRFSIPVACGCGKHIVINLTNKEMADIFLKLR